MTPITRTFQFKRGDSFSFAEAFFYVDDETGNELPLDLTDKRLQYQLRRGDRSTPLVLQFDTEDASIVVQGADHNRPVWQITPAQSAEMHGQYRAELQVTYPDGSVQTWTQDQLTILNDTTV